MQASELKPGQFFECNGQRRLCTHVLPSGLVCYVTKDYGTTIYHSMGNQKEVDADVPQDWDTPKRVSNPTVEPLQLREGGCQLIANERARQIEQEGWTPEHDNEHKHGELIRAAILYAGHSYSWWEWNKYTSTLWPWHDDWWKPEIKDRIRNLEKAGGLIAAEIDRLIRTKAIAEVPPPTPEPEQFKAGDLVVCVDAKTRQAECNLVAGAVYEVRQVTHLGLALVGGCCWDKDRFRRATAAEIAEARYRNWSPFAPVTDIDGEPLEVGDHVTCIACESRSDCRAHFQIGVEYPVTAIDEGWIAVGGNDDHQPGWCPLYFRKVNKPQPDADGWIEHDGKGCPVDDGTLVEVRLWDGATGGPIEAKHYWWGLKPSGSHPSCITHYRLVEQPRKQPIDWVEVVTR